MDLTDVSATIITIIAIILGTFLYGKLSPGIEKGIIYFTLGISSFVFALLLCMPLITSITAETVDNPGDKDNPKILKDGGCFSFIDDDLQCKSKFMRIFGGFWKLFYDDKKNIYDFEGYKEAIVGMMAFFALIYLVLAYRSVKLVGDNLDKKEWVGVWSMIPKGAESYINKFNVIITCLIFSWILFGGKVACILMDEGKIDEDNDKWLKKPIIGAWPIYDEPTKDWKGGCRFDIVNKLVILLFIVFYAGLYNILVNPTFKKST